MAPLLLLLLVGGGFLAVASSGGGKPAPPSKAFPLGLLGIVPHSPPPMPATLTDAEKRWQALGTTAGNTVKVMTPAVVWAGRPDATAEPADIDTYLSNMPGGMSKWTMSPVFAYPEMGWAFDGDSATASYSRASGDNVQWTAQSDGSWTYQHQYPNSLQQTVNSVVNAIITALPIALDLAGFAFAGMFVHVAQAIANHESLSDLGNALKSDWDRTSNAGQLAFNIVDGDWAQAWNAATEYGKDLSAIVAAFSPDWAPDIGGNLTIPTTSQQSAPVDESVIK